MAISESSIWTVTLILKNIRRTKIMFSWYLSTKNMLLSRSNLKWSFEPSERSWNKIKADAINGNHIHDSISLLFLFSHSYQNTSSTGLSKYLAIRNSTSYDAIFCFRSILPIVSVLVSTSRASWSCVSPSSVRSFFKFVWNSITPHHHPANF